MKKIILFLTVFLMYTGLHAQLLKTLGDKAKAKINQRANNKVDNAMDKGLDQVEGKDVKKVKEDEDGDVKIKTEDGDKVKIKGDNSTTLSYTSKYDFVQGEKVVAYEDFGNATIGDFPTRWNTDASAEIVTLNTKQGKWLKINNRGHYHPEFITNLPENSTLEFDMGVSDNYDWGSSSLYMNITHLDKRSEIANTGYNPKIHFEFHPMIGENYGGGVHYRTEHSTNQLNNNGLTIKNWDKKSMTFAHVSLWRQGQRLRMYVNGEKIIDLPRIFNADGKYTDITFETNDISRDKGDYWVLGNFRLAVGAPDTRNKLITEGKFVTSGILFDVNSDKIRPESNGVLKEIANVLTENPDVKVKIVGHTDSDGDAAKNLDLSKRRAASVKAALSSSYNIDASRMETDGMGASKPVSDNKTTEGKAQNRRVEFIKM